MSSTDFYLAALVIGLVLSVLSLVLGGHHLHFGRGIGRVGFGSHVHAGRLAVSTGVRAGGGHRAGSGSEVSPANFSSLVMFLAWFGGAGAILRLLHVGPLVSFVGATISGGFGAYLLMLFLRRILLARDHAMRAGDYALPGVIARVSLAIRAEGTGEISYVLGGTRKSAAARADGGEAIPLGTEVVVLRFENGIAHVRPWQITLGA